MPIFEYACTDCGARFEQIVSRDRADEVRCQSCDSTSTARQLSVFGVATPKAAPLPSPCAGGMCGMPPGQLPQGACAGGMCGRT